MNYRSKYSVLLCPPALLTVGMQARFDHDLIVKHQLHEAGQSIIDKLKKILLGNELKE
jgi:hypothetical protein